VSLCSYGVNFVWARPDFLIFGVVLDSYAAASQARTKVFRANRQLAVPRAELERAVECVRTEHASFEASVEAQRKQIIDEYRQARQYETDLLASLRDDLQKSLSVLHDYRQFLAQVRQNLNVILERRYPQGSLEDKLGRALPAEQAIYWACLLMTEKLELAFLMLHPERLTKPDDIAAFRVHGAVHKYLKIYGPGFAEKGVKLKVVGESVGLARGNVPAFGVIPHTFIDNALKYAPRGSEVVVGFVETQSEIQLSVVSQGPKIDVDEETRIFELFYRGRHAERLEEVGAGFGLYAAQLVAKAMGTEIKVEQQRAQEAGGGYTTEFSVTLERVG
jgi:K+-sensing histidine kinase KdpD